MAFAAGLGVGLGLLLALVFAKYSGITKQAKEGMNYFAAGALSYILAAVIESATTMFGVEVSFLGTYLGTSGLFGLLGLVLVLVGSIYSLYELLA